MSSHLAPFIFKVTQWSITSLHTVDTVSKAVDYYLSMGITKKSIWKCQATFCLWQGPLHPLPHSLQLTIHSPPTHTLNGVYMYSTWYHASGDRQYCCDNCICLRALCTIQRTHAKQCHCMSECYRMTTMCSKTRNKIYAYVCTCAEVCMYTCSGRQ